MPFNEQLPEFYVEVYLEHWLFGSPDRVDTGLSAMHVEVQTSGLYLYPIYPSNQFVQHTTSEILVV